MTFHPLTWRELLVAGLTTLGTAGFGAYFGSLAALKHQESKLSDLAGVEAQRMGYILDRLRDEISLNRSIATSIHRAQQDQEVIHTLVPKDRVWEEVREEYRSLEVDQDRRRRIEEAYDPIEPLQDLLPDDEGEHARAYIDPRTESESEAARERNRSIKKQANRAKNLTLSALQNADWEASPERIEHAVRRDKVGLN